MALIAVVIGTLAAPAAASAELTISTAPTTANITETNDGSTCTFTATDANAANVSTSDIGLCAPVISPENVTVTDTQGSSSIQIDATMPAVPVLTLDSTGLVTQDSQAPFIAAALTVSAVTGVQLNAPSNSFTDVSITNSGDGGIGLQSSSADGIAILKDGVTTNSGDVSITAPHGIGIFGPISASSTGTVTLQSPAGNGPINQMQTGAPITAGALSATTPFQIVLNGSGNQIANSFSATSTNQFVEFADTSTSPLALGPVSAPTQIVVSASASITVTGTIASQQIWLTGAGFSQGSGGQLTAGGQGIKLTRTGSTPATWTANSSSINGVSFTGTPVQLYGSTGGDTFDVSPSKTSAFVLDGSSAVNGTVNFDAGGQSLPNNPTLPDGGIALPPFMSVSYNHMQAVNIVNPAPVLTLAVTGVGGIAGTGGGISGGFGCSSHCTQTFNAGSLVTLTATPATSYKFAGWSGGGCSGTGTCTVTLNSDTTITAAFTTGPPPKPPGPKCAMSAAHKLKLSHKKPTLAITIRCNERAKLVLRGSVSSRRHKYRVRPMHANARSIKLKAPIPAVAIAAGHASASFTLAASNSNGSSKRTLAVRQLKL